MGEKSRLNGNKSSLQAAERRSGRILAAKAR